MTRPESTLEQTQLNTLRGSSKISIRITNSAAGVFHQMNYLSKHLGGKKKERKEKSELSRIYCFLQSLHAKRLMLLGADASLSIIFAFPPHFWVGGSI